MEVLTVDEAREQLQVVFRSYPSFEQSLRTLANPKETTTAWATMLTKGDAVFVRAVVQDIATGEFDPVDKFDKWDALPRNILKEADRRRDREWQRHRTQRYAEAASSSKGSYEKLNEVPVSRIAVCLGARLKKKHPWGKSDDYMRDYEAMQLQINDLFEWENGGPQPEWLTVDMLDGNTSLMERV